MHLSAVVRCRPGLASNSRTLTRSTGEPVHLPNPLYPLDDGMVAIPNAELDTDERVVLDLNAWALHDLDRERSTGLLLYGPPGSDLMHRLATRYVREARELPQHEANAWAHRVIDDPEP